MLSYEKTSEILNKFHKECEVFWLREGKSNTEAARLALRDISHMKHDPYVPCGELLDEKAKYDFMRGNGE
jgi:hypothetical protein